ncbi:MAG: hypothetical protein J6R99_01600, partial [Alphaproteobacteria bacterium]|nr:hypothetical protein [Alphaproteobacteria bacterium]
MKIIKFIIPSLLLFMPIGVFAEECKDYTEQDACQAAATTSGCYWISGETDVVSGESTSECRQCLDGKYSIETECKECPAGHYCVGGIWARCPAGTYNPNKGSSSVDDCTPCPAGKYSYAGESGCRQCTNMPFNSNGSDPLRAGEYSYLYDEEYGERKSNNCPWKFSCGENLKPKCDLETKTCTCESCGSPYEYSVNKTGASSMIYNGTDFEADPGSVRTCPGFQPLYLYSSEKDSASSDQKKFEFYVILKHGEVLLSATASSNPDDFKNAAQIANVNLSNGLNYTVKFEISDGKNTCTFSSLGCGRQDTETCTVRDIYGDCTYDSIKTIVGDNTEWKLDVKWFLDVPVLIAKKRLEFEDEGKDNTLHITYLKSDDSCFKWAASAGEVVLDKNGEPQLNGTCSANEADINAEVNNGEEMPEEIIQYIDGIDALASTLGNVKLTDVKFNDGLIGTYNEEGRLVGVGDSLVNEDLVLTLVFTTIKEGFDTIEYSG